MSKSGEIADALVERLRIQGHPDIEAEFRAYMAARDEEAAAAVPAPAAPIDVLAKDGGVSLDNPIAVSPT